MNKPITIIAVLAMATGIAWAAEKADPCIGCHTEKTPGIVAVWKASAHSKAKVACASCHGDSEDASHSGRAEVTTDVCGSCHKARYEEHKLGKHSMGLRAGQGCTRNMSESEGKTQSCALCHLPGSAEPSTHVECAMFLAQTPEMRRQGCNTCHRVEAGCDACHTKHGTGGTIAGLAETCGVCHMGPDHPQIEMWTTSMHGALYKSGGEKSGPTCVTCHMEDGNHNISLGIATGRPDTERLTERARMAAICSQCHTPAFSSRSLDDADKIERQSLAIVKQAEEIVSALDAEGLLFPAPSQRPAHPLFGHKAELGSQILYENISRVEAEFFRMQKFYYPVSFKAAFHQNPAYAHWYGNAPLKMGLSEIKSEAVVLRKIKVLEQRIENMAPGAVPSGAFAPEGEDELRRELRALKDRHLKGGITADEYEEAVGAELDRAGY